MEIFELSQTSVSVQSSEYGMRAYVNTVRGRAQLETECPAGIVEQVYVAWGTAPTLTEPEYPTIENPAPTTEERLTAESGLLKAQVQALNDRGEFVEDCIAELAMQVYA